MLERYKMELENKFGQNFSLDMIDPGFVSTEIEYKDFVLWIDPIDASSAMEFNLEQVTTIIGISVKGRPKAGIIHRPFHTKYTGRTYVGTPESGLFYYDIEQST